MTPTRPTVLCCAIYARVSSDRQDVENSLDRQLRACRRWAQEHGHAAPESLVFIDEAKSGASTLARPAFQRLLALLRSRAPLPFDAVLLDDDSRLDRGGRMAELVEAFQGRRVRLITVDNGRDLTEEDARLLVHVKSGLNEHYLSELARRTRNGLASRVLHGYHAGGRTYGYRLVPEWPAELPPEKRDRSNRIGTRVEIEPDQATIVLRIFDGYAAGAGFRAIARDLNGAAIPSSRGASWDQSAIRAMLLNPRYAGDWSWNRRAWQKAPESLLTEAERERIMLTGRHPRRPSPRPAAELVECKRDDLRIVPPALWEAVQARFAGRVQTVKGGRGYKRSRSPIAGLLSCSCGGNISLHTAERKGHRYSRLFCPWNRNRGPNVCGNATSLLLEDVAGPILAYVRDHLLAPDRIAQAVELVNRKIEERHRGDGVAARVGALRAEVARLEHEIANLVDALARGTAYESIQAALAAKDARLAAVRAELAALERPVGQGAAPRIDARDVQARLGALWDDIRKLDGDRARLALGRIFDGITVKPLRGGSWAAGWTLEMRTRPQVGFPEGAVVSSVGCGARI